MTVQWYRNYYRQGQDRDLSALCIEQIRDYMNQAAGKHPDPDVEAILSGAVVYS